MKKSTYYKLLLVFSLMAVLPSSPLAGETPAGPAAPAGGGEGGGGGKGGSGSAPIPADPGEIDAWFSKTVTPLADRKDVDPNLVTAEATPKVIKVRQDGTGDFKTLTEAVESVPAENKVRTIIEIGPGEYKEKVKIEKTKPYISLVASDPKAKPTLVFGGTAKEYGTVQSGTITVESDYFVASNIIFANSAPRPGGQPGGQALAIRIYADKAAFYGCRFIGFQDTICDDKGTHLYKDCYIEGTVDFIFGSGRTIFLNCEIHVVPGDKMAIVTAQAGETLDDPGAFVFAHGQLTGEGKVAYLGRSWFPAPTVVYLYTTMSDVVIPQGWNDHGDPKTQKTVQFGEYKCKGPGADRSKRVTWSKELTDAEAAQFLTLDYINFSKWLAPPPSAAGGAGGAGATPAAPKA